MTVVRENPIPPGRYWLDLIGDEKRARFEGAVKGLNEAHPGLMLVESTTHHAENENQVNNQTGRSWMQVVLDNAGAIVWGEGQPTPVRDWVLFKLTAPTVWDFEKLGSPTIAGDNIHSEGDTVQRPDPTMDPLDKLHDTLQDMSSLARGALGVIIGVAAAAGVVLLVSGRKRR